MKKAEDRLMREQYGLSAREYSAILAEQEGVCAICGNLETITSKKGKLNRLAIDHNRETKFVRGLLCSRCNRGIGYLKHSKALLNKAVEYIDNTDKAYEECLAVLAGEKQCDEERLARVLRRLGLDGAASAVEQRVIEQRSKVLGTDEHSEAEKKKAEKKATETIVKYLQAKQEAGESLTVKEHDLLIRHNATGVKDKIELHSDWCRKYNKPVSTYNSKRPRNLDFIRQKAKSGLPLTEAEQETMERCHGCL